MLRTYILLHMQLCTYLPILSSATVNKRTGCRYHELRSANIKQYDIVLVKCYFQKQRSRSKKALLHNYLFYNHAFNTWFKDLCSENKLHPFFVKKPSFQPRCNRGFPLFQLPKPSFQPQCNRGFPEIFLVIWVLELCPAPLLMWQLWHLAHW